MNHLLTASGGRRQIINENEIFQQLPGTMHDNIGSL
jgi:hypothetical protein